jgi:2-polyprenyl-6-methoxyphenol hydroxylase-like FAD-dependent oxidoreductase
MGFNEINSCSKSRSNAGRIFLLTHKKIHFLCSFLVWDACSESLITFDQETQSNENSLAYIVENDVIQSCLLERLKQFNVELRLNSKVKEFEYDENSIRIKLQDEKINLRTGLLV